MSKKAIGLIKKNKEAGMSLLEYAAGAAVLLGVVWGSMNAMGTSYSSFINAISNWATNRGTEIANAK